MSASSLLTDRQKLVLQYRRAGKTQQEVADILQTSRSNISTIEKAAHENIRMAKEALEFLYMLDA
ncbi:MAG: Tfx family DNA-binding protein, partial [Methanocorpusculum sp.]|nr:Tfx family DNA-binding protein [Methanocorpusculum sp.]MBR5450900.1 Tfx family DNA-binding protein [Methanocorpusculum sp.]